MKHKAHGDPTKDFFVYTITKDVSIEDCILDLLDNSLDGSRRLVATEEHSVESFSGYKAEIAIDANKFKISDNCGGMSISQAIDYAFHFGRRSDAPVDDNFSIGLYGIGMKRAIFKLGNLISIYSSTATEAFRALINVKDWIGKPDDDWDFDLEDAQKLVPAGTVIEVTDLHKNVSDALEPASFKNRLARIIGRDYFRFIDKGFEVKLNGISVPSYAFTIRQSEDFKPARIKYTDGDVEVEIISGMAGSPPDDLDPNEALAETDYYGWFVLCNDRVVLASDKTAKSIWGHDGFPVWHFQYNGFVGFVSFNSRNSKKLPWTTTKRDIDQTNEVYRRAIVKMKEMTRPWLKYTAERRQDIDKAKASESQTKQMQIFNVDANSAPSYPKSAPGKQKATVSYSVIAEKLAEVKTALGNANMSNREVGTKTFEYFVDNELGE
jgi:hypothetical protein